MFNIPTPMLMSMQQNAQQQFQPYQGSQSPPQPNPMDTGKQDPMSNPLMMMMQKKGMDRMMGNPMGTQNILGAQVNPLAPPVPGQDPQAQGPGLFGGAMNALKPQYVQGMNAPLANTQTAADSPFTGNANFLKHGKQPAAPAAPKPGAVPNTPIPAGNMPKQFTPQTMTDTPAVQGVFPQWLQTLFR